MKRKSLFLIFFFFPIFVLGQTKTNLNIFNELVDSSVVSLINNLHTNGNEINLKLELGNTYSLFQNRILYDLKEGNIKVNLFPQRNENITNINFAIEKMEVNYYDIERESLFGEFLMPRELTIKGNFSISRENTFTKNYNYTFLDTVNVKAVSELENASYTITKGKMPSEPFFSSITEPVIVISSAAVAVILFFTIRSK
ncbi:MAG: hypothetical protein COW08_00105 [Ignavibacteriales bacterium CG12_big_fil_rev_8_21_14_0_65_30_8]|nr:MAG: hypothetical protein COW08_00105 [Ignavibacteriales bacterium CG12_big_fil_rev_8_21_14_0_65_30_8]